MLGEEVAQEIKKEMQRGVTRFIVWGSALRAGLAENVMLDEI